MAWKPLLAALVLGVLAGMLWQWSASTPPRMSPTPEAPSLDRGGAALLPLPAAPPLDPRKLALGKRLFFDARLSHDDSIACATCHDLARGGMDGQAVATGIYGQKGLLNTPTVFNAALQFAQFWDGRAATLEEQAAGPVHNPIEMGSHWAEVVEKLRRDESYRIEFAALYPDKGVSGETIADAIAAYERSLLTPSRFDAYLAGDENALNALEKRGYRVFLDFGCASCHQGAAIGGNLFQRFGVVADYFAQRPVSRADLGRYNVTGRDEDRHVFKVPSLRNVALTAPYFHDASAPTLEDAIQTMARYQLGRTLTREDLHALAAFLRSLTGTRLDESGG